MSVRDNNFLVKKKKIYLRLMSSLLIALISLSTFAQTPPNPPVQGCYEKINQEFKSFDNISKELNEDSMDRLQKMLLPSLIPASFFLMPGFATAFLSLFLSGARDQVQINKILKTAAILDISYKAVNQIPFKSEDYFKLGVFYKFKLKIEQKSKSKITDYKLARLIMDEDKRPFEENLICELSRGGNVVITPFNSGLRRKIYKAFKVRDDLEDAPPKKEEVPEVENEVPAEEPKKGPSTSSETETEEESEEETVPGQLSSSSNWISF